MRRSAVLALAATAAVALSACGSSTPNSSSTTATASPAQSTRNVDAIDHARLQAAICMRAHGINIPDFTTGRTQVLQVLKIVAQYPATKVQAAAQACAASIRRAFPNAFSQSPEQVAQRRQQAIVFAQCMRSHGISFPDPTTTGGNLSSALSAINALDVNSPAFKTALQDCRPRALKAGG